MKNKYLSRCIMLFVLIFVVGLLFTSSVVAVTPPIHGESKPAELLIYLPWESGTNANVVNGNAYGEGAHLNTEYYAFDFNLVPEGGNIYPVAPGRVIFAGHATGYGNTVIIYHVIDNGGYYYSQYSHLETLDVSFNQEVDLPDILGKEGTTTKDSTGPHLHFVLRRCDEQIADTYGYWPTKINNTSICHSVVPEPFVGQHIYEGLGFWNYLIFNRIFPDRERVATAWRPSDYGYDITAPSGYWGSDTPDDLGEVNIDDPVIFDMYYSDNMLVSEIRATIYYADWLNWSYPNPLPGFDSSMVWRILARCDPREVGAACQSGHWRFEWIPAGDHGFPSEGNGLLQVPWMPKAKAINVNTDICISFDVFDQAGNAMYAPGGVNCSLKNQVKENNARRIKIVSAYLGNDIASFITDVTLPDGTVTSPGESLTKTWRIKNTGSTTWGNGYQLVFVSGEQMGAIGETVVPSTAPGQTVDLSININAPTANGEHTGYFRLRNPQGTYFGPTIWVKIRVGAQSNKITVLTTDPASPADTDMVRIHAKSEGISNFRAMRIKIDGEVKYELGAPEIYYSWDTSGYAAGAYVIVVEAADQTDTSWAHPEMRSLTFTLTGSSNPTNHAPNPPGLISPYDWQVFYSGNTAQLCVQENGDPDGDAITGYYFEIYDSAESWNSGWTGNNCATTSAIGPHNYKWRVKVRDTYNAESEWSDTWNFTLVNPSLSISELYFQPQDGDSEVVKIRACTIGQGGIGITMRVSANDANDGSANGQWHIIKELGVPCFNETDAPLWRTMESGIDWGDGSHLVRVEAHGLQTGWDGAAVREEIYTLPHRRPSDFRLMAPRAASGNGVEAVYLNSRTATFKWDQSYRATAYTLSVGIITNPSDDPNPVLRQSFGAEILEYTYTFDQDYPALYWQVSSTNDKGGNSTTDQLFGIDRAIPSCSIQPLASVSYENNFQVRWNGTDALSGIGSYSVQYADSRDGQWADWMAAVAASKTYDLFIGQPGHTYSFRCQAKDNAENLSLYPSVGDTSITIDPAARPPETWALPGYALKRNITVQNNMPASNLPANYPVNIKFTAGTSPSATEIYNASLSANKCDDLRIVHNNTTQLNRFIKTCAPDEINIWFRSQTTISGGGTDTAYQMYIGNSGAINTPADASQIWYPYRESDTSNLYLFQEGSGSIAYDSSGNGRNCTINPSVQWSSGKWGSALLFNQYNNGATVSLTCGSPYPLSAFTVEFWYKPNLSTDGRIVGQLGPDHQLSWLLSIESDRMKFERWCSGCGDQARGNINFRNEPYYSQWNYLALTFNGSNEVKFYVNGILDNTMIMYGSGMGTYNIPLEIGSVEGSGQGKYYIGALRLSNSVKTNFDPGFFASITNEPSSAVGTIILPPATGEPDLAIQSLNAYPNPGGGVLIEAVVKNEGTKSTINGFYTDLYVDHLPTGAGDYTGSLSFWVNDPIAASETVTLTTVITDLAMKGPKTGPFNETTMVLYGQTDSTGVLTEPDDTNNIYTTGVEICVAGIDGFEGDDTPLDATPYGDGQLHNFSGPADQDWIKFTAVAGNLYWILTSDLGVSADTYLYLYDTDATTLLLSNDDWGGTLASRIGWIAPADGTYYLLVKHWNPNIGGCGTSYTLSVAVNAPPVAVNDSYTTAEDTPKTVAAPGLLGNDTDADSDPLTAIKVTDPAHGTVTLNVDGSFIYTPNANWNGIDSFTYKANDGTTDSNIATVTLNVTAVNDVPVANAQSVSTTEDTAKAITLTATDPDDTAFTWTIVTPPAHGALSGTAPNVTYTPAANYSGADSFTFKVNDGDVDSNVATVTLTVTAVNDPPVANNQTVTTNEDTAKAFTLTATDAESSPLTWTILTNPAHGTLTGTVPNKTYTPAANWNGADSFTYKVNDGTVDSNIATVTLNVTAVNDPPVAVNDSTTTAEDMPKTVAAPGVLGNDTDVEGSTLTAIKVTNPAHGTVTLNTNGSYTYTPAANWNGTDSFTYKANDGTTDSNIATVTMTVNTVNDPPVANNQTVTASEDTAKSISITATDADSDPLNWTIITNPAHGTLSGTVPDLSYMPSANWNGTDTFTFKVNDGVVDSNTATVTLNVTPINDAPVALNNGYTTNEDILKTIPAPGVLGNDIDVDGDTLTAIIVANPTHGTLSFNANGSFTYTPDTNWNGSDSFTYKANDGTVDSNVSTVTLTVNAINDPPVANNQSVNTTQDTPKSITLTGSDIEGTTLTWTIVANPAHGALSGTAPNVTYTPAVGWSGTDTFTFKVNDGNADSNIATVTILVTAVNAPPVAVNNDYNMDEDTTLYVAAPGVLGNDTDADSDPLTAILVIGPAHGTLTLNPNGSFTYIPYENWNGTDSFMYTVYDGSDESNLATVTITVADVPETRHIYLPLIYK